MPTIYQVTVTATAVAIQVVAVTVKTGIRILAAAADQEALPRKVLISTLIISIIVVQQSQIPNHHPRHRYVDVKKIRICSLQNILVITQTTITLIQQVLVTIITVAVTVIVIIIISVIVIAIAFMTLFEAEVVLATAKALLVIIL